MATRQNKKRKGRNNAPPRERTVTTLTDGPDGPFMSSSADEQTTSNLISPPFSVTSPIPASGQPPGISPGPFPLQPFSNPFPYPFSQMSPLGPAMGAPFQQQHSSPPFFPQNSPLAPSQQPVVLPTGKNDLEILERLKETIKNNQHEFFRPIPQPAALASVFLGPRSSSGSSHVPPHPEQIPTNASPPGLTLNTHDTPKLPADGSSANVTKQITSPRVPSTPDLRDGTRKPVHRSSVSESPKTITIPSPIPAAKRVDRYEPSSNSGPGRQNNRVSNDVASSPRFSNVDASPRMGPPGSHRLEQSGRSGEITQSPATIPAKLPSVDSKDDMRRETSWSTRNGHDDRDRGGPRNGSVNVPGTNDSRGPPPRDQRPYDREQDREHSRDRDYDREKDRDRRPDHNRFREDRRPDDRRPLPAGDRRYEPRHVPPRRYDSKSSEGFARDERNLPESRPPPRNLGEERAIIRPPVDSSATATFPSEDRRAPAPSVVDDRSVRPPAPADDRRVPLPPSASDRQVRPIDDHRPLPPPVASDRPGRLDDRRPPPLDRPSTGLEDRRRPLSPERAPRTLDDHRAPAPAPALPARAPSVDRQVRPSDERRPPVSPPGSRLPVAASDDRRPLPAPSDRPIRAPEDRRPAVLEERITRAPAPAPVPVDPARPPIEDRSSRPSQPDDRTARPVSLEERISRVPSLQERLSYPPPARPEDKPVIRLEERLSRPANPATLEERLSNPPPADTRPLRPPADDRPPPRQPPPSDRPVGRAGDDRTVLAEPARAPPLVERPPPHSGDRHFAPAGRFARPASPAASDRGRPYRAASVAHDEPRSYRPHSPGRPPSRADVREFRPIGEPRDRDPRPPYRPEPDRYPSERRPDPMDVESPRFSDRASYRRPSPSPGDSYPPRADRAWVPAGEAPPYRDEPGRRPTADSHAYSREWREGDRAPYGDDYDCSWDRSREYDRDSRFPPDRDAPPSWETREERERRAAYPSHDLHPSSASRPFEQRPLSSRLTDSFPGDDRGYTRDLDRRYPPPSSIDGASSYTRVRPRSPSPVRRSTASDDMRPPLKRAREDRDYPSGGYYPSDDPRGPSDYPPPRLRTPPPTSGGYYDDPRYTTSPGAARDGDYLDSRDRDVGYGYERRGDPRDPRDPPGRMPPPRSPPPYGRPAYGRDDRRYSVPPRG